MVKNLVRLLHGWLVFSVDGSCFIISGLTMVVVIRGFIMFIITLLDATGQTPKYHIPARFVTLIPREFPAAQTNSNKRKSATAFVPPPYGGGAQQASAAANPAKRRSLLGDVRGSSGNALDDMLNEMGDFQNLQSGFSDSYWSGTESGASTAWYFSNYDGSQYGSGSRKNT